ncbi:hypothetical protein KY345_00965 [Candidatus Woesearchaeota archaeon]|nr:hypothetical protein [Candidatus Woesearchaeota archaeon]
MKEITKLESIDDVDALMPGDAVEMEYRYYWNLKEKKDGKRAAYHGVNKEGMHEFVVPHPFGSEDVQVYRAYKERMKVEDGKVILDDNKCTIESIGSGHYDFKKLCKSLKEAEIR